MKGERLRIRAIIPDDGIFTIEASDDLFDGFDFILPQRMRGNGIEWRFRSWRVTRLEIIHSLVTPGLTRGPIFHASVS